MTHRFREAVDVIDTDAQSLNLLDEGGGGRSTGHGCPDGLRRLSRRGVGSNSKLPDSQMGEQGVRGMLSARAHTVGAPQ